MTDIVRTAPPVASGGSSIRLAPVAAFLSVLLAACAGTTASSSPTLTVGPSPSPAAASPSPSPSPAPTVGACDAAHLVARIIPRTGGSLTLGWSGAAGHRIADIELTNTGPTCTLAAMARPQLIDGHGAVIIDGTGPGSSALLTVGSGSVLKTLVQDGNYCGPTPAAPVTVAFVLAGGAGRVAAIPVSSTDTEGVPPCLGAPGSAGDIEMHPWS